MSEIILKATGEGFRLIGDSFDIIIDPADTISGSPDAFLISSIHNLNSSLYSYQIPIFVSDGIKSLALHPYPADAFIVGCMPNKKQSLRKGGKMICDFAFTVSKSRPESGIITVKANNKTVVYISGTLPGPELIPNCDTLIINAGKQTPLISMLNIFSEFTVEITDYSHFFEVINIFNSLSSDNTVGIDHTAMESACHYLKNNYTVFSRAIKPLSQFSELPPIIITTDKKLYPNRPAIPDTLFFNRISLSEIYNLSSHINATNIIAYCPDFEGERKRGNITITGMDTIFPI